MEFDSEEVVNEPDDTPSESIRLSDIIIKWQVLLREKVYTREPLTGSAAIPVENSSCP